MSRIKPWVAQPMPRNYAGTNRTQLVQVALMSAIVFTLFCLPLANSTYFFGYDPFYYLMMTTEIIRTGDVSTQYNHPQLYPMVFANLSSFSGVDPMALIRYSTPFAVVFLGLAMYVFARRTTGSHWIALCAFVFVCLSSGYNFHWFYQFHVNFIEQRPAYLSWAFNLLFFCSLSKYMDDSRNRFSWSFVVPALFLAASLFTYFLSSGLALFAFVLFASLCAAREMVRNGGAGGLRAQFEIFAPVALLTAAVFGVFFFSNLDAIREIVSIEGNAILRARHPLDYFEFLGVPAALAIAGVAVSLKRGKYAIPLCMFIVSMAYMEGYWLHWIYDPLVKMLPLSELVVRDSKVPTAFFAAVGLHFLYGRIDAYAGRNARAFRSLTPRLPMAFAVLMVASSSLPAVAGLATTMPFTYTDRVPMAAFGYLDGLPQGTLLSDEFTCMMAYDFTDKPIMAGMYPKAGVDFSSRHDDQEYLQHQLEDLATIDGRASDIEERYSVRYFMLNFGIWGRMTRAIESNPGWNKVLDSDQAALFVARK